MTTIKAECGSCRGTGLYEGFAERKGEPVICLECNGTGCSVLTYTPYTGRKDRRGVKTVRYSRGRFIFAGVGPTDDPAMTYAEFKKKVPEESVK